MIESTLEPLFHISSLPKHWTIADVNSSFVITETNLELESFSLYESICDADRLDFGRCSSARVSFTCLNIDLNLINRTFNISFTFDGYPNDPFQVGVFTVVEDKPSPDRRSREVVLQDALYFILNTNYASWYNALTWTNMTLGGFIDSFLAHVGLTADSASRAELVNAGMPLTKTLETNELLGSTILYAVCQVAGCFGVINRDGEFKFLYLKSDIEGLFPANDLYPAEDLYPIEPVTTRIDESEYYPPLIYETYMTPQITKLHVAENSEDAGTTIGTGDSQYNIVGNFLLLGKSASDINTYGANILGAITKRNYRPYSVSKMGNLCFELGDAIRMSNDRIAVESYILTRTFSGTQGFIDDISADGTQDYNTVANTASTSVQQLTSKTLKLRQDVDEVSTTMTEELALDGVVRQGTYAYQTNAKIGAKVDIEYGNHTTDSFSWDMDITGHAWYKGSQQVMKVDGNGLHVTGLIEGSDILVGTMQSPITYISADGQEAIFADDTTSFSVNGNHTLASIGSGAIAVDVNTSTDKATIEIGNSANSEVEDFIITNIEHFEFLDAYSAYVCEFEQDHVNSDNTTSSILAIGSTVDGSGGIDKVAVNGWEWVHIGVSSPSVHIGGTNDTENLWLQADTDAHIKFKFVLNNNVVTVTLADLRNGISTALTNASSAASAASSAQSDVNLAFTAINSLSDDIRALEAEARNHGWNV